jgi:hypothetical protein
VLASLLLHEGLQKLLGPGPCGEGVRSDDPALRIEDRCDEGSARSGRLVDLAGLVHPLRWGPAPPVNTSRSQLPPPSLEEDIKRAERERKMYMDEADVLLQAHKACLAWLDDLPDRTLISDLATPVRPLPGHSLTPERILGLLVELPQQHRAVG